MYTHVLLKIFRRKYIAINLHNDMSYGTSAYVWHERFFFFIFFLFGCHRGNTWHIHHDSAFDAKNKSSTVTAIAEVDVFTVIICTLKLTGLKYVHRLRLLKVKRCRFDWKEYAEQIRRFRVNKIVKQAFSRWHSFERSFVYQSLKWGWQDSRYTSEQMR